MVAKVFWVVFAHYYAVASVFWLVQGVLSSVPLLSFHLFDYSR